MFNHILTVSFYTWNLYKLYLLYTNYQYQKRKLHTEEPCKG